MDAAGKKSIRVCVVGAGAAGLCAAKHLCHGDYGDFVLIPTVYERSSEVGGTWVYHQEPTQETHSSMYRDLHTNLPKELMAFPDLPMGSAEKESFLHHSKVLEYLQMYAEHFDLRRVIRFNTEVTSIKPVSNGDGSTSWRVEHRPAPDDHRCRRQGTEGKASSDKNDEAEFCTAVSEFDAVMVCNGHFSAPNLPEVPGLTELFQGPVMHSHWYREPSAFKGKNVLVLGARSSGSDIALEVSRVAETVWLSHNLPAPIPPHTLPGNVRQVSGVVRCTGPRSLELKDHYVLEGVDALLICTGYRYSLPFLDDSCGIEVTHGGSIVQPLFMGLISAQHPTMCLVGLQFMTVPFPLFDLQCQFFLRSLVGLFQLPDRASMTKESRDRVEDHLRSGRRPRDFFCTAGDVQWEYRQQLAEVSGIEDPMPSYARDLFEFVAERRRTNLPNYRQDSFEVSDDHFVRKSISIRP